MSCSKQRGGEPWLQVGCALPRVCFDAAGTLPAPTSTSLPRCPSPPQYTRKKDNGSEGQALLDFARGLSGGAPVPRSKFLFDAVNLPQVRGRQPAPGEGASGVEGPCWSVCLQGVRSTGGPRGPLALLTREASCAPHPLRPLAAKHLPPSSSTTWRPRPSCSTRTAAPRSERRRAVWEPGVLPRILLCTQLDGPISCPNPGWPVLCCLTLPSPPPQLLHLP